MQLLSKETISELLQKCNGWNFRDNSILKIFEMKDFSSAISFIVRIGIEAEKMDHHPDLHLHGWNKVTVSISTHSAGGVTKNDFELAHQIERLL